MEKLKTLEEIKEQFATKSKDEIIEMFYNSSKTALELEVKNKDLQKSVEQIYEDYKDIGKMFFDLDEKVQNIIKQLNKEYEQLTDSVKRYEEMRRNCQDGFYFNSYQTSIHKLNAKRETIKSIIEMLEEK